MKRHGFVQPPHATLAILALSTCLVSAQGGQTPAPAAPAGQAPAQGRGNQAPAQPMSFFITSTPIGKGGNLGGLAGADAHCQTLAAAAGAGNRVWRAYLSTQGPGAVNARDRIGKGPWVNVKGQSVARDLEHLHGDTLELARMGNTLTRATALNEKGEQVPGVPFPVFLLTGILAWNFFSSAALNAAVSLVSGASLINKAAFPRIALPVSAVLASAVNYVVTIPILIAFGMLFGVFPTFFLLLLPGALLLILLMAIGVGALLSALMPFFNDLQHLIEVALTIWFFLTPVVYPMSQVPEGLVPFYRLNPMVGLIELVHSVFLGQALPFGSLAIAVAGVVVVLGAGLLVFRRVAKHATEV